MPALAVDLRFNSSAAREKNAKELKGILEKRFAAFSNHEDALRSLESERVPCAPVLTLIEAMNHPHNNQRKTVRWIDDPILGRVPIPGVPVKFSAWPDKTEVRSALLGEDNERVLRNLLNFTDQQILELYEDGVLVRDAALKQNAATP